MDEHTGQRQRTILMAKMLPKLEGLRSPILACAQANSRSEASTARGTGRRVRDALAAEPQRYQWPKLEKVPGC
eukprot:2249530-Pyramimonas_sp.AAC.1